MQRSYRFVAFAIVTLTLGANPRGAAAGDVSERGAYQTSVTIDVPLFHDITPSVRLTYDSNAGNGPLGVGWLLSVGSQIGRTSRFGGVPRFDVTDQLWLDGLELVPCAAASLSASCRSGGTHTTRVETYRRISADAVTNTWTVWTRDGARFQFTPKLGNTASPTGTRKWLLTEVLDTHGNRVAYEYRCGAGDTCYISDISYGDGSVCRATPPTGPGEPPPPLGSLIAGANVHFIWETRTDPQSDAIGGGLEETFSRLRAIDVSEGAARVRVYQINYQPESSILLGYRRYQSWIESIQVFGSDAVLDVNGTVLSGTAMPARRFESPARLYAPAPSFLTTLAGGNAFVPVDQAQSALPTTYFGRVVQRFGDLSRATIRTYRPGAPFAVEVSNKVSATPGDFDGDAKLDFLEWSTNGTCEELKTKILFANPARGLSDDSYSTPQANLCMTMGLPADLDGDGRTDVLFLRYKRNNPFSTQNLKFDAEIISARSNGNGTFELLAPKTLWTSDTEAVALQSQCNVGDINGDRRADLACTVKEGGVWVVLLAISDGEGRFNVRRDFQANTLTDKHTAVLIDANGDGLSDLFVVDERGPTAAPKLDVKLGVSVGEGTFVWRTQSTTFDAVAANQKAYLLSGDFNADGRADVALVLGNDNDSGGSITAFTSQAGAIWQFRATQRSITGAMPVVSVADWNGDRLDDLVYAVRERGSSCNSPLTFDHVSLTVSYSDGSETFDIPSRFDSCYSPSLNWPWVGDIVHDPHMTNVNGDGIPDLFQYYEALRETEPNSNVFQDVFELADRPGEYRADDIWRWRATDINGDGRMDWVHVSYANLGLTVLTQITQADGARRLVRQNVAPSPNILTPDLTLPDALSTWFLADVGGGSSNTPDGKADIVIVDDVGQQIITLLANGDGTWTKKTPQPYGFTPISIVRGHASTAAIGDISNWRAMDVNGDGLADLVHISFRQAAGQAAVHVTTLPALGDGTWGATFGGDYLFGGNVRHTSVLGFAPADVNGDGRMDLVAVEPDSFLALGQNAIVWSLISNGTGSWDDRYAGVALPSDASGSWRPMDVNGDGKTDLVSIWTKPGEALVVSSMLSLGNGRWQAPQNTSVSPAPIIDTAATADVRMADLDGDGKSELVFLNRVDSGQMATMVVWNRYPRLVQTTTTGLVLAANDTLNWQVVDLNADDRPEILRVQFNGNHDLDVVNLPVWERRMTRASNGMGASEDIAYVALAETDREMPLGALPHVVASVSARAVKSTGLFDAVARHTYSHAVYSWAQRRVLGFKHAERTDGVRIRSFDFDLGAECGVRSASEVLLDDQRRPITRTTTVFAPTGFTFNTTFAGTHAYSLCRVDTIQREEWERSASPRRSEDTLTYDDYGNVIEVIQHGDLNNPNDDRRMKVSVNPNTKDYLVDRPAEREVYEIAAGGQWRLLSRTRFEYDHVGALALPPGSVGDLSRIRRWNNLTNAYVETSYEHDGFGNLRFVTSPPIPSNPAGVTTTIEYECELNRFPERVSDPLHATTTVWDKRLARVTASIDANGGRTDITYDPLGRLRETTAPDLSFDRWIWPAINQWNTVAQSVRHERSDGSSRDGVLWNATFFDGLGRTTRVEREGGIIEEILKYDGVSGRILEFTTPRFASEARAVATNAYDAAGRLTSSRNPDASSRRIRYDVGQRTVTNELGAATGYDIDAFGRIVAVRENRRDCFAETCPVVEKGVTRYGYDALDRLGSITDTRKNTTVVTWDSLGRVDSNCDSDRGCARFTWNDDGAVASETDANGSVLRMTYDSIGRLAGRESINVGGNTTRQVTWSWDVDPVTGSPSGSSQNRVTRVEDKSKAASLVSTYRYDRVGRIDQEGNCVDRACYEIATQFDAAGRIKKITYPGRDGRVTTSSPSVDYQYDDNGMLASLPGYVSKFTHTASGRTTQITFANRITESRPHDRDRGWSDGVRVVRPAGGGRGGQTLFRQALLHDSVGRVREETIESSQGTRREVYGHDDLGRLNVVTSTDPARNRVFIADILGNLTSHSQLGTITYGDPAHVHAPTAMQSGERYTYDQVGQMRSSNRFLFSWTDEHRPNQITDQITGAVSRFAYDRYGVRVKADVAGVVTLTPHAFVDVDASGAIVPWIVAEGRRVARLTPAGPNYLHTDALGSTRLVTDKVGGVVGEYDYGVWGEAARAVNPGVSAYQFAGNRVDTQTGLTYMNARYYDANAAHFISADSIIPNLYAPQSLNRYAYVLNDPVSLTDPSGYAADCVADASGWGVDCSERRTPATGQQTATTPGQDPPDRSRGWDWPFARANEGSWERLKQLSRATAPDLGTLGPPETRSQSPVPPGTPPLAQINYLPLPPPLGLFAATLSGDPADTGAANVDAFLIAIGPAIDEAALGPRGPQGRTLALGLGDYLDEFAAQTGGSTYKEWAASDPLNWRSVFRDLFNDPANKVNFNLTGVDSAWGAISRAAGGIKYSATDWELLQIYQSRDAWNRVTFWNNGQIVPNPFQ